MMGVVDTDRRLGLRLPWRGVKQHPFCKSLFLEVVYLAFMIRQVTGLDFLYQAK